MTILGTLRRRILTPDVSATSLVVRGFHVKDPGTQQVLEAIGRTFLQGFAAATETGHPLVMADRLESIPTRFRGFAYEGAAMGFATMDGLPFGHNGRVADFLSGSGEKHIYMVYVGVGWAMARLPRFRWHTLTAPDPLLQWLVLDGYGFHQAYFHTDRYVRRQFQEAAFPWPSRGSGYANRAIDQGIGRAMWFVGGAAPRVVAELIDAFPMSRRPDLYSGAGLAATYAGGVAEAELRWFARHAGSHRPQLAQGAVFAATARIRAGLLAPHTELAVRVCCDMTPHQAMELSNQALLGSAGSGPPRDELPQYESWRRRIASAFAPVEK